jgi:RNA-directed DNA polymerase
MKTKMIEQILTRKNLLQAMRQVQKNHGSAGVDHMPVTKLSELMSIDKEELAVKVRSGKYLPQPILGVEITKGNGKTRLLGIPTVTDRLLQRKYHLPKSERHDIFLPPTSKAAFT